MTQDTQTQASQETIGIDTQKTQEQAIKVEQPQENVSEKLAAIAKRDKAALMRMRAAQAKETDIAQREAKLKDLEAKYSKKPANPIDALIAAGFSYKDATDFVLNGEKMTPDIEVKKIRSELDEYKQSEAEKQRQRDEQALTFAKQQEQEVIENFKNEIADFIEANPSDYELIKMHDGQELVFATINEHFERTKQAGRPKIMTTKEASDLVEQHLFEKIEESLAKASKLKSKYGAQPEKKDGAPVSVSNPAKTLTNSMSSSAASTIPARTENERIQRALAALEKTG